MPQHSSKHSQKADASAEDYLAHAKVINQIARVALREETEDLTDATVAKIAIGLSLQAAELAGKAILRSLGWSTANIFKKHSHHELLPLLQEAQNAIEASANPLLFEHRHFLLSTPIVNGQQFGNTMLAYFSDHFAQGAFARPRNYFYPDQPMFAGPVPIQAIRVMVDDIIGVAEYIAKGVLNQTTSHSGGPHC